MHGRPEDPETEGRGPKCTRGTQYNELRSGRNGRGVEGPKGVCQRLLGARTRGHPGLSIPSAPSQVTHPHLWGVPPGRVPGTPPARRTRRAAPTLSLYTQCTPTVGQDCLPSRRPEPLPAIATQRTHGCATRAPPRDGAGRAVLIGAVPRTLRMSRVWQRGPRHGTRLREEPKMSARCPQCPRVRRRASARGESPIG